MMVEYLLLFISRQKIPKKSSNPQNLTKSQLNYYNRINIALRRPIARELDKLSTEIIREGGAL